MYLRVRVRVRDASLSYLVYLRFTAHTLSWIFTEFGIVGFLSQSLILSGIRRCVDDAKMLQLALVLAAIHFLIYALSSNMWSELA